MLDTDAEMPLALSATSLADSSQHESVHVRFERSAESFGLGEIITGEHQPSMNKQTFDRQELGVGSASTGRSLGLSTPPAWMANAVYAYADRS